MMMYLLNKKYEGQETHFNWGKYAFNKFLGHIENFEPKIIDGLAEPKVNMHFGLRICYILECLGIPLRETLEIPVTNSLFRHAFEEKEKLNSENEPRIVEEEEIPEKQTEKASEPVPAKPPSGKRKRTQKASKALKLQKAQPSGDRVSEESGQAERPLQTFSKILNQAAPELSVDDRNIIDGLAPNSDSEDDLVISKIFNLKKDALEGTSKSVPQKESSPSAQQVEEGLAEEVRMLEDVDIASTFVPAKDIAEENPVTEQVPQLSERAQLSERDQTETGTQNDNLEETFNELRAAEDTMIVQEDQPNSIQANLETLSQGEQFLATPLEQEEVSATSKNQKELVPQVLKVISIRGITNLK